MNKGIGMGALGSFSQAIQRRIPVPQLNGCFGEGQVIGDEINQTIVIHCQWLFYYSR